MEPVKEPMNFPRRRGREGMALLLVLGSLIFLAVLTLAFLNSAQTNLRSAKVYANGASVRTLADSTVSFVQAQIQVATSGGSKVAWASQPGMIRTYDDAGAVKANYKLYSWDTFSTAGTFDPASAAEAVPATWYQSPSLFVDLNKPVVNADGKAHYPIVSGNNLQAYTPPTGVPAVTYMTGAPGKPDIEGFWVRTGNQGAPVAPASASGLVNQVPMPVKWLYVLENGTIVAPTAGASGTQAQVTGAKQSPIVGRIAFWTDDDTSKVNVNTASEGSFWDTPRTGASYEWSTLGKFQPAQNEFQRYPGHPATTCLSPVLGSILPIDHTTETPTYSQFQPYYDLSPKLNANQTGNLGSQAGTVFYGNGTGAPLTLKADRLYATVDEFLFKSGLPPNPAFGGTRAYNNAALTSKLMEETEFFLTARSRSPDVNLFNKPRIGIWPVNVNNTPAYRTIFDQVIAFCGTIGNNLFYFQRQKNDDPANDLPAGPSATGLGRNRMLVSYLQDLTNRNVPGFGGSFNAKYPAATAGAAALTGVSERDQILTEMFDYVRSQNLEDQSSAAMTHPFAPAGSSANATSPNAGFGTVVPIQDTVLKTRGFGRFPTVSEAAILFVGAAYNDGQGGINANDINASVPEPKPATSPAVNQVQPAYDSTVTAGNIRMQAILLLNLFDPSQGYPNEYGSYHFKVTGLDAFTANGKAMGFPIASKAITSQSLSQYNAGGSWNGNYAVEFCGGNLGFRTFIEGMGLAAAPAANTYTLYSTGVEVPYTPPPVTPTAGTPVATTPWATVGSNPAPFDFGGGTITVQVLMPNNTVVQTINLTFPEIKQCPAPRCFGYTAESAKFDWWHINHHIAYADLATTPGAVVFNPWADVVRSVRAWPGDIRMIAGRTTVNAQLPGNGLFDVNSANIPEYFDTFTQMEHGLVESTGMPFYGNIWGQLVSGVNYGGPVTNARQFTKNSNSTGTDSGLNYMVNIGQVPPTAASGNNPQGTGVYIGKNDGTGNPTTMPGDWDNGISFLPDGAYINKADEGDMGTATAAPYFSLSWAEYANVGQTFFSPNRLMPSAGMFGSLSTGVARNIPWMTLLFCPDPAAGDTHPGFGTGTGAGPLAQPPFSLPPDHLFLDLFTMPVVEPYPISEPLSTAGRINMNCQIVPFTYIERNTGLRAVLKAERITAIPDTAAGSIKGGYATTANKPTTSDFRLPINLDETLKGFDDYFTRTKDIFRSATQICQMFLYPSRDAVLTSTSGPLWDAANANIEAFWTTHRVTGDNSRERPYTTIYPRLTTKSNTYTVHLFVQTLKKAPGGTADVWDENRDVVTGEYRGSTTVERYVDPADTTLPDFADPTNDPVLDGYYKFRVVGTRQFSP